MVDRVRPPILWHYTDVNGLFGIVRSSQLRFGNVRFLNDRTERLLGDLLLEKAFAEAIQRDSGGAEKLHNFVSPLGQRNGRLYICSFSEAKDSLSQWQRYGADGAGYCIGFDSGQLDERFASSGVRCQQMVYEAKDQEELLRNAIDGGTRQIQRVDAEQTATNNWEIIHAYLSAARDIDAVTLRLKNQFFHDENEWRYILPIDRNEDDAGEHHAEFAVSGAYVKPFVSLPHEGDDLLPTLPIVAIVCGPRLDFDLAEATLRWFLSIHGYSEVSVERSVLADTWR